VSVVRGGYGTSRIIDKIDFERLTVYPKWFIGFSDVTVLLSQLYNEKVSSIHGPVGLLLNQKNGAESKEKLFQMLTENTHEPIRAKENKLNNLGTCSGELIGGNLTILHTLLNTKSDIDYTGKILFIEDLDEYLYHIDRMMVHLERSGKLAQLAGLVIGHMSDMNDNKVPFGQSAYEIIYNHCKKYSYPVGFGFPIGHEPQNSPVFIGKKYNLAVESTHSTLSIDE